MSRLHITLLFPLLLFTSLASAESNDPYATERQRMVQQQMAARGIKDPLTCFGSA